MEVWQEDQIQACEVVLHIQEEETQFFFLRLGR